MRKGLGNFELSETYQDPGRQDHATQTVRITKPVLVDVCESSILELVVRRCDKEVSDTLKSYYDLQPFLISGSAIRHRRLARYCATP